MLRPDTASADAAQAAHFGGPVETPLLLLLALPWFVHAAVVLASALGAHPLAGRASALGILVAAGAFAWALARPVGQRGSARELDHAELPGVARSATRTLAIAAGVAFALAAIAGAVLPVIAYDALAYRLPLIAQWLDAGRIAWVSTDDPVRNGYPMGQEAVSAVVAAAIGSLRFSSVTSFVYVASGALAIWSLAERCGVRRPLARLAAGMFVLAPMMILNAPSGYVDAAFAGATVTLFCGASMLVAAPWPDWRLAAATGMSAAHVLALKGTGLAFVVWVGAAVLACMALRQLRRESVRWSALAIVSSFAASGAFWALRNLARTGNPLWPVQIKLAGHTLAGVGGIDSILDTAHNTPPAFVALGLGGRLLRSWFEWHGPAVDFDDRMAGLGLAWPLLALPAIVSFGVTFLSRREPKRRRALQPIAVVLLLTAGCFALQPMSWWPRYTLWVWGGGALAIAAQAERLAGVSRPRLFSFYLVAVALLCVGEGALALTHAKDAKMAIARMLGDHHTPAELADPRRALNASSWISPEFWRLGIELDKDVCRGWWKPKTDNPNLDGVFAQLTPRPRLHVLYDDDGRWLRVRRAWQASGCPRLLLFNGSPVLRFVEQDPTVSVERSVAFDPIFIVRPRTTVALGRFGDLQP